MRNLIAAALTCLFAAQLYASGIPAHITYQGTLRDKGVPANGSYTLSFRITDVTGLTQYWASGPQTVTINQGLFTVLLSPAGVDWQNVTPYIEVSVGSPGQTLGPLEPINASVYANMSESVVDGAITQAKIDPTSFDTPGVGLVPQGAILMFNTNCPSGWTRFSVLDNGFPLGVDPALIPPSTTGGTSSHAHSISMDGAHNHGGVTARENNDRSDGKLGGPDTVPSAGHTHNISTDGLHDHKGWTGSTTWLPPYAAIVFCQKQ